MVSKQIGQDYLLRFDKDELLVATLLKFIKERGIHPSWLQGMGGALWADIGFYHLDSKQYSFKRIDKSLEIVGITGNITWLNNQPIAHLHVVVSDDNLQTYGGHLKELAVAGTCEILLKSFDQAISRRHDEATGLDLIDI